MHSSVNDDFLWVIKKISKKEDIPSEVIASAQENTADPTDNQSNPDVDNNTSNESIESNICLINSVDASNYDYDYGFNEDRTWVRSDSNERCLINTAGEIIYRIPASVMVEVIQSPVDFVYYSQFNPMQNGTTYFTGRISDSDEYYFSEIIDTNGKELARFIGSDDLECYIAGRTDERFLLVCFDKSETDG